jgi:putative ABC transport system ATP-binding protein
MGGPPLVVADEPTAELDSASGQALLRSVAALTARGTAFVVATHDPAVVELADRTLFLRHGALEAEAGRGAALSVIDAAGRIQLPPEALSLFPDRRAQIVLGEGELRITPP